MSINARVMQEDVFGVPTGTIVHVPEADFGALMSDLLSTVNSGVTLSNIGGTILITCDHVAPELVEATKAAVRTLLEFHLQTTVSL